MYLKYISALYDYYEKEFNTFDQSGHTALPLVVNTSGWVKGLLKFVPVIMYTSSIVLSFVKNTCNLLSHSWSNGSSF